ncbi:M28 family peptidase [Bacillus sp. BRMEA1]|uniref:M28 family peptidase n=1 Tax=Neobacillus endophyticus TaxID=2738405 RepID=UPI0015638257|nr:M28 family peptidase [Neobacillus endophyticus]NRD79782.1 M28 family peptidase [Neobacillus endophyticus]
MKKEHIQFIQKLSNPGLDGRVPGTKGHEAARKLILDQFKNLSLTPLLSKEWEQTYTAFNGLVGRNLLAQKKGSGEKWLLLGAHYDHIKGCPGANDNAAALGILLSVLDSLKTTKLNITIVLAFFDMEEPRYFMTNSMGSIQFYHQSQKILNYNQFLGAIILDLCGHNLSVKDRENSLFVIGGNTSPLLSKSIKYAQENEKNLQVFCLRNRYLFYLSDHYIFEMNQKPNLFLTCGHFPYYHTPEDTFEKLNLDKTSKIASFIKRCILAMNHDQRSSHSLLSPENTLFNRKSEAAELGRFLEIEVDSHHNLDLICQVFWREISKGQMINLERIKFNLRALGIL